MKNNPVKYPLWRLREGYLYKYVKCRIPQLSEKSDFWKLVLPKEHRLEILKNAHGLPLSGHPGIFKTFGKVYERFYWPKMKSDITKYINSCRVCAACKFDQKKPAGLMGSRPNVTRPFQLLSLDLIGALSISSKGYRYILVVCDYFSKFVLSFPLRTSKVTNILRCLENEVFLLFGVPQYLICDNGQQFKSNEFQQLP